MNTLTQDIINIILLFSNKVSIIIILISYLYIIKFNMSFIFNFLGGKTDKELINGQRILHFSVNQNPKENEYILISINEKTTCEDILKDITIKEQIKKKLSSIEGFHFAVINPENVHCELKLSKKHKPSKYLGFESMLCFLPDRKILKDEKFRDIIFKGKIKKNKQKNDPLLIDKEEIFKWNQNNKKFDKLKGSLSYKNLILEGITIPISKNFLFYKQFTSASSKLRENMQFSGNENIIEIRYNNQVLIFNLYNKELYNIWCKALDEVVINNKLSCYQDYVDEILNQYILFLDFVAHQPNVVEFKLNYFLSNKIWRKYLGNEDPSKDKNFLSLMDLIINYKISIKTKKYLNAWTQFVQIVSLIDIIFSNKEKPDIIKKRYDEYIDIKNKILIHIQELQKNSKTITNDGLSDIFRKDLFDDLLYFIISNEFWTEVQKVLYDIEIGNLHRKALYFINKLSKYMADLFMKIYHFSPNIVLKFNNSNGTMNAHYETFKNLKKKKNNID